MHRLYSRYNGRSSLKIAKDLYYPVVSSSRILRQSLLLHRIAYFSTIGKINSPSASSASTFSSRTETNKRHHPTTPDTITIDTKGLLQFGRNSKPRYNDDTNLSSISTNNNYYTVGSSTSREEEEKKKNSSSNSNNPEGNPAPPTTVLSTSSSSSSSSSSCSLPPLPMSRVTPLVNILRNLIGMRGPLTVSEYIRQCLTHPDYGYYTRSTSDTHVFGTQGDFTTSPEISQMFGELMALWIISAWQNILQQHQQYHQQQQSKQQLSSSSSFSTATTVPSLPPPVPTSFTIIECGPGKGTLITDILRVLKRFPNIAKAVHKVQLVETSHPLRAVQAQNLQCTIIDSSSSPPIPGTSSSFPISQTGTITNEGSIPSLTVEWYSNFDDIPSSSSSPPVFIIAQELFDALPVHQLVYTGGGPTTNSNEESKETSTQGSAILSNNGGGWRERLIDTYTPPSFRKETEPQSPSSTKSDELQHHFRHVLATVPTPASIAYTLLEETNRTLTMNPDRILQQKLGNKVQSLPILSSPREGDVAEYCPIGVKLIHSMTQRLQKQGGGVLVIDYGSLNSRVWSLRGIRKHKFVSLFDEPGETDLSADVDYSNLIRTVYDTLDNDDDEERIGKGEDNDPSLSLSSHSPPLPYTVQVYGPTTQGEFLQRMGIVTRFQQLLKTTTDPVIQRRLYSEIHRLIDPSEMGTVYKVMGMVSALPRSHHESRIPQGSGSSSRKKNPPVFDVDPEYTENIPGF